MKYDGEEKDVDFNHGNTIQNGTADSHQEIQVPRTPHAHPDQFSENLPLPLTQSSHLDLDGIESFPSLRDPNNLQVPRMTRTGLWATGRPCPCLLARENPGLIVSTLREPHALGEPGGSAWVGS